MIDFQRLRTSNTVQFHERPVALCCSTIQLAEALTDLDHFAFLDSSCDGGLQGKISALVWEPVVVFRSKDRRTHLRLDGQWQRVEGETLDVLEALMKALVVPATEKGVPFSGGAIGYFGYDLFPHIERYDNLTAIDDLNLPDMCLAFHDAALVYDHARKTWSMRGVSLFREPAALADEFDRRMRLVAELLDDKPASAIRSHAFSDVAEVPLESNFTKPDYLAAVRQAIEHIFAGDIYQINLSQRFTTPLTASPFSLFRTLRQINPSYYGAYLHYDTHQVISSSPELFLCRDGSMLETRPIKGTRPRGKTSDEDLRLKQELQQSPKEAAELSMIVDLERNDLGRVCDFGSVVVDDHRYVEALPTVFHTISTVRGRLRPGVGPLDILRATFPGGSITGCPKIRAIEIIDQLEPTRRNVYTGSIGWIGFDGNMLLNIAIRTLIVKDNRVYFQVGGGIVADSDPESEYQETLDKAAAMLEALRRVEIDEP